MALRIYEIYDSLQGESSFSGLPCVFVRTSGCSLRCRWCDSDYAFQGGEERDLDGLLEEVAAYGLPLVLLTGGEPLDQPDAPEFLRRLCDAGHTALLETGGHLPLDKVDPRVRVVMDVKCPSSKMARRNRLENLDLLGKKDEVKFVIADRADYDWAADLVRSRGLDRTTNPLFSPVHGELEPAALADWIRADRLPVRFQIQLHKLLWGAGATRV